MDDELITMAQQQERHDLADEADFRKDAQDLHNEAVDADHRADAAWNEHKAEEAARLRSDAAEFEKLASDLDHRAGLMKDAAMFARFEEHDLETRRDLRRRIADDETKAAEMQGRLDRGEVTGQAEQIDLTGKIGAAHGEAEALKKLDDGLTEDVVSDMHHEHERDTWAHDGYQGHPHPELGEGTPPGDQPHLDQ